MKKIAVFVFIIVGAFLAAMIFSYVYVNEDRVSAYLNENLGEDFQVQIQSASFNLINRSLAVDDISIQDLNSEENAPLFTASKLSLKQIGLYKLLRGDINIGTVDLENGDLDIVTADNNSARVYGINLNAGPIQYNSSDQFDGLSSIQNAVFQVDSVEYHFWEDRYRFRAESLRLKENDSEFSAKRVRLEPAKSEDEYFQSFNYKTELFQVAVSDLMFTDIDFEGIRNGSNFNVRKMMFGSSDIHITVDKSMDEQPDREESPLPLEVLNNLPFQVNVDSLLFQGTDIRYSEYAEDGEKPGTIHFANTAASFTGIRSGSSDPVVFEATSYLEETGEFNTRIEMSMDESGHLVDVRGKLGEFDATRLNNIFMYLEGIRIKSGNVYDLEFYFQMNESCSAGSILIHYDDLSIEKIDNVDLNSNFGDRIAGFFYDQVALRSGSENNGQDAREGEISREREPERSFFNNLWRSLRTGLLDVIKRL